MTTSNKKIVNLFFELGVLAHIPRSGWQLSQVNTDQSVADHTVRTALLAYVLAEMEGADPIKTAMMALLHDLGEIRIGDQNKVAARYISKGSGEVKAFFDQTENLPTKIKNDWRKLFMEKEKRTTKEGIVAQDADWLECAISAKEFYDQGYKSMADWIKNTERALETKSAKILIKEFKKTKYTDWWKGLKKMTYKKLYPKVRG